MKQRTFDNYSDPGHGWLKVPKDLIVQLGIASQITEYSYERRGFAYLEEDQDTTTFIEAMKKKGIVVKVRDHIADKSSRIRNYESYFPTAHFDIVILS